MLFFWVAQYLALGREGHRRITIEIEHDIKGMITTIETSNAKDFVYL
jgi:hypothetical protein